MGFFYRRIHTFNKVPHFDQGIIVYICFDETFRKFINFINCPITEKVWENPVHLIYTYLMLFSVLVSYLYKLDNNEYLEEENPEETREKLAAVANFIDATGR